MKEFVIGAEGFIGSRLLQLTGGDGSTRRNSSDHPHNLRYCNLLDLESADLPDADVVYICAAINGAKFCEGNQEAFRINVDGPIGIAEIYAEYGCDAQIVWISSMGVEWGGNAYQRQKLAAELVLRTMPDVSIVRAGRVTRANLDDLCKVLMHVGRNRISGVTRWGTDELAYEK